MPEIFPPFKPSFDVFSPSLIEAIEASKMPGLSDGPKNSSLSERLSTTSFELQFKSQNEYKPPSFELCLSGLWLLAGDLNRSHEISQKHSSAEGSFWHGIMHRREGDFGNAKYWFRRVGNHPVITQLQLMCPPYKDPSIFTDFCCDALSQKNNYEECQRVQWTEWLALMTFCAEL